MILEVLLVLFIVFVVVTVLGHVSWLLLAWGFRAITGDGSEDASSRSASQPPERRNRFTDLAGYRRIVDRLFDHGWLDQRRRDEMHALGKRYGETLQQAESREPRPVADARQEPSAVSEEDDDVLLAALADEPSRPIPSAATASSPEVPTDRLGRPDPLAIPDAVATPTLSPQEDVRGQPSAPRRAASEVLQSFLIAHNIRWGELVAGLLIVVCAIGLVISLWSPLTRTHRLLPSLVFMVGTISIEAAGLYTLNRWRLRHTSRAVLLIATLLVPLSVVAGIAVARSGEAHIRLGNPLTIGFLLLGTLIYGVAIWRSGIALVQRVNASWWTLAVAAPTIMLPLLPALARQFGLYSLGTVAVASTAVATAMLVPAGRRRLSTWRHRKGNATTRNLLWIAGVGIYSLAILTGFLLSQATWSLDVTVPVALSLLPALVAVAGLGLSIHETASKPATRVVGSALAMISILLALSLCPVAVARPSWIGWWAGITAAATIAVALRLGTRWLVALAPAALGIAGVLLVPHWIDGTAWQVDISLWRRPLQASAMLTSTLLGLSLAAIARGLQRSSEPVRRFALPITVTAASWMAFSMLVAFFVGCFGWLIPGPVGWVTSAIILMLGGCFAIALAAFRIDPSAELSEENNGRTWRWLLAVGQGSLLLGAIVWIGWSVPDQLFGFSAWKTGRAVWCWLGLIAGFAFPWQGLAWAIRGRGRLGALLAQERLRLDEVAGVVATVGLIGAATASLISLLTNEPTLDTVNYPAANLLALVAIGLTLAWQVSVERQSGSSWLRGNAMELCGFGLQSAWLWGTIQITATRLPAGDGAALRSASLIWTGSSVLGLLALVAALTWWSVYRNERREQSTVLRRWDRFAGIVAAWTALVVGVIAARLVQLHGGFPGDEFTQLDRQAIVAVTVWLFLGAAGCAIGSVATNRAWLAFVAATLFPLAASLLGSTYAESGWQEVQWGGLFVLGLVLCQRAADHFGSIRWLRQYAIAAPELGRNADAEYHPTRIASAVWPLPVVGLAWLGIIAAAAFALLAMGSIWVRPAALAELADWYTLSLVVIAGGLVWYRGSALGLEHRVSIVHLVVLAAGVFAAIIVQHTDLVASDAWRLVFSIWMGAAVVSWGWGIRRDAASDRLTAIVLFFCLAALGWLPRVFHDWTAWISLSAAVLGHAALLVEVRRWVKAEWRQQAEGGDVTGSSSKGGATLIVIGQIGAFVIALFGFPLLLSRLNEVVGSDTYLLPIAVAWCVVWVVAWRVSLPARPQQRLPRVDAVFAWLSLLPLALSVLIAMIERVQGVNATEPEWLAAGLSCLIMLPLIATTVLRVGHCGQWVVGYLATMAGVVLLSSLVDPVGNMTVRVAVASISCATAAVLATWLWPLRRALRLSVVRWGIDWSDAQDRRAGSELVISLLATALGALGIAFGYALSVEQPLACWLAIAATALCGWALAAMTGSVERTPLRTITVLLFCLVPALMAIVHRDGETHHLLASAMRLFVAGVFIVPACLWWVPKVLSLAAPLWQRPLRIGAAGGAGLAGLSLVGMLAIEGTLWGDLDIMAAVPALVIGVAVVLAVLSAMSTVMAVWPRTTQVQRVLPNFSDGERKALIYTSQVLAALTWLHLYLCDATEFMDAFRGYWPYVVMGLAFLTAAATEWARRRQDRVLSETLRQSALFLPLIPAIGFWFSGSLLNEWAFIDGDVSYAMLLIVGAFFYLGLSLVWRTDRIPRVIGVVLGNAAVWVVLTQTPGWGFLQHPQLWLIPPAVCVLIAVHLERARLESATRTAVRYAATLVIYVSSTADLLLQDIGSTIWGPIILVSLAMLGVAMGMVLRIQAFLYLGTFFVLIGVLSMVWHAQKAIDQTWPWWVFGMTSGVLLLAGLMAIEKNKAKLKQISSQLASWE